MRIMILALLMLVGQNALCSTVVKVGGYLFPPFVNVASGKPSGLTLDLIQLLNKQQSEFQFQFVLTSPKRRYLDFNREAFDALFFENKQWGWQEKNISASHVFLTGGEVYITKKTGYKTQDYFNNIHQKSLAAILGYHYQFANFNSDEKFLKSKFNIELATSPSTIINQVLSERVEIGIVTRSFLAKILFNNPDYINKILASNKFDQVYKHTILVRNNHPLTTDKINALLKKISSNGSLDDLLKRYGLTKSANSDL